MSLVSDILTEAFLDLAVIAPGETISTAMQTDAFLRLNQLLGSLSTEGATVFNQVEQTFNLVAGSVNYTLGSGGTFSTTGGLRAQKVTAWRANASGVLSSGGPALSMAEFGAIARQERGRLTAIPEAVGADTNYPLINIAVYPPPSSSPGTLTLHYWTPIPAFATVGDTVSLPPGYEDMLHFNLAVRLAPQYARATGITQELAANAQNSKASIIQQNTMMSMQPQQAAPQKAA
jgi:hypothetical protein